MYLKTRWNNSKACMGVMGANSTAVRNPLKLIFSITILFLLCLNDNNPNHHKSRNHCRGYLAPRNDSLSTKHNSCISYQTTIYIIGGHVKGRLSSLSLNISALHSSAEHHSFKEHPLQGSATKRVSTWVTIGVGAIAPQPKERFTIVAIRNQQL